MKLTLFFTLLFIATTVFAQKELKPFINSITQKNLEKHVYTLASDKMAGRGTGKAGQKLAAEYIAGYYRSNGLDSLDRKGYFQPFDLYKYNDGSSGILLQSSARHKKKSRFWGLYGCQVFTHEMEYRDTLTLTYLGFGHDVETKSLKDKVVVLLLDETLGQTYENIKQIASKTGAKNYIIVFKKRGLFFFNPEKDKLGETSKISSLQSLSYSATDHFLEKNHEKYDTYVKTLTDFFKNKDTLFINTAYNWELGRIIENKSYKDLVKLEKKIAKGKKTREVQFKNDTAICIVKTKLYEKEKLETENVLAFVEGTDKKDEVIVVSAHYDHIGKYGKKIYYGADDNASGTGAVMEMAAAFQKAAEKGIRPSRSIIFVAFSGEEVGLRGSDYFVDNCPVPLDNVVLNLNLDMIGRNRNNDSVYDKTAYILSKGKHKRKFRRMGRRIAKENDSLILSAHPGIQEKTIWTFSSDHFRFKRKGIPFACFFTGTHSEYHTPKDTPDKINYPKLTEITRTGFELLWDIANLKRSLTVNVKHSRRKGLMEKMID